MADYKNTIDFIKSVYGNKEFTPLAVPVFQGNEKAYLNECIDTTFVSSVGKFVDRFEEDMARYTGAKKAVVCVSGTNALHMSLMLAGVQRDDECSKGNYSDTLFADRFGKIVTDTKKIFICIYHSIIGFIAYSTSEVGFFIRFYNWFNIVYANNLYLSSSVCGLYNFLCKPPIYLLFAYRNSK